MIARKLRAIIFLCSALAFGRSRPGAGTLVSEPGRSASVRDLARPDRLATAENGG